MGGTVGKPPQREDQLAPDPSITVEEFRAQFTEEMRWTLWEGVQENAKNHGHDGNVGMRALQLIGLLHPAPYTPIGA